jgi:hypothetical protein
MATLGEALKERHIAFLKDEIKQNSDLIALIDEEKVRFYSRSDGGPAVDTTEGDLAEAKRKLAVATRLLEGLEEEG